MNKVYTEVSSKLDEAIAINEAKWKTQKDELQKYEADILTAEEKADQCLASGDMEGYREQIRKSIEYKTASEKLQAFIENGQRPPLTDQAYTQLYNTVKAEMDKQNAAYTKKIYDHLTEAHRLAVELFGNLQEGRQTIERLQYYGIGKSPDFNIRLHFTPDVQHLIANLRQLGFMNMYRHLHKIDN